MTAKPMVGGSQITWSPHLPHRSTQESSGLVGQSVDAAVAHFTSLASPERSRADTSPSWPRIIVAAVIAVPPPRLGAGLVQPDSSCRMAIGGPNLHVGPGMSLHCLETFGKAGLKRLANVVVAKISYQPLDRVPNHRVR